MSSTHLPASELSDGFWHGRQFRMYHEVTDLAPGAKITIRAQVDINILLHKINVTCDAGALRVSTMVGSTEEGTFSQPINSIPKNTMQSRPTPVYESQVLLSHGGSLGVGTGQELDVIRVAVDHGRPSVGENPEEVRGITPATYYFVIQSIGNQAAKGLVSGWWEELTK